MRATVPSGYTASPYPSSCPLLNLRAQRVTAAGTLPGHNRKVTGPGARSATVPSPSPISFFSNPAVVSSTSSNTRVPWCSGKTGGRHPRGSVLGKAEVFLRQAKWSAL